ncbi:MAG: hypothetical protein K8W52_45470 [Deltaproteobacteria bacterium]|nr:hypothetical protein [Deltaproteobacteria bacterium]
MALAARPETSPSAEPRTGCPVCGNPIHPIAGKCKHCKTDLVKLRRQAHAAAQAQAQAVAQAPAAPLPWPPVRAAASAPVARAPQVAVPPAVPPPVVMPTIVDEPAVASRSRWSQIWPIAVAIIAAIAIIVCVVLLIGGNKSAGAVPDGEKIKPPPAADNMNTNPLSQADPWNGAPPPSSGNTNPGGPAVPAPAPVPAPPPPAAPSAGGPTPRAEEFVGAMYTAVCKRLDACGTGGPDLKATCDVLATSVQNMDSMTHDQFASGACTYHVTRAERCLRAIEQMPCGQGGSFDVTAMTTLVAGMGDCANAVECTGP